MCTALAAGWVAFTGAHPLSLWVTRSARVLEASRGGGRTRPSMSPCVDGSWKWAKFQHALTRLDWSHSLLNEYNSLSVLPPRSDYSTPRYDIISIRHTDYVLCDLG